MEKEKMMGVPKTELRPAWRNYIGGFIVFGFVLIGALGVAAGDAAGGAEEEGGAAFFFGLAAVILGMILWRRYSWKFEIDNKRVSRHYGILARNQQSLKIRGLRSVEMDQNIIQRILGTGTLKFYSAGSGEAEIRFPGILDPVGWRDKIDDALDREQDKGE